MPYMSIEQTRAPVESYTVVLRYPDYACDDTSEPDHWVGSARAGDASRAAEVVQGEAAQALAPLIPSIEADDFALIASFVGEHENVDLE